MIGLLQAKVERAATANGMPLRQAHAGHARHARPPLSQQYLAPPLFTSSALGPCRCPCSLSESEGSLALNKLARPAMPCLPVALQSTAIWTPLNKPFVQPPCGVAGPAPHAAYSQLASRAADAASRYLSSPAVALNAPLARKRRCASGFSCFSITALSSIVGCPRSCYALGWAPSPDEPAPNVLLPAFVVLLETGAE